MKNDLTRDEWLILAEHIHLGGFAAAIWDKKGLLEVNNKILKSAIEKFDQVATELKGEF